MPEYKYTARNTEGNLESDVLTANSSKAAADFLRSQSLVPTSIKEASRSIDLKSFTEMLSTIKLIDKITFIKNLAVMIKSGLPVSKALKALVNQTPNPKLAKIVADVSRQVEGGNSLADALGRYPNVFPSIFVSMVRVGEVSGSLEQNLSYLAEQMQRDYDLMSKAKGAMTYPVVIMVAITIVGFLMFTFVLPKLTATFTEMKVELPILTRIVIAVVDVFAKYGLFIMLFLILAAVGFFYWRKTSSGKNVIHKAVLYLPVFSGIVKKLNMARFVRVFSSLIKSGMPIVESLEVSSQVVGNVYYQQVIKNAAAKVKVGAPLAMAFKKEPKLFSNMVVQMMEVGEESGTTDTVLTEVASFYESDIDQTMKNLSSILEPVIMMVIGAFVGILALALLVPIYNITQNAGG